MSQTSAVCSPPSCTLPPWESRLLFLARKSRPRAPPGVQRVTGETKWLQIGGANSGAGGFKTAGAGVSQRRPALFQIGGGGFSNSNGGGFNVWRFRPRATRTSLPNNRVAACP